MVDNGMTQLLCRLAFVRDVHEIPVISFIPNLGRQCLSPPEPDEKHQLSKSAWNGEPVEFNDDIIYKCDRGQKFNSSVEEDSLKTTCLPGNYWTEPAWEDCVESMVLQTAT